MDRRRAFNPGRDDGTFDGFTPNTGSFDFYGNSGANGTLTQTVDLLSASLTPALLDAGATVRYDFFEQSLAQGTNDSASVNLTFLDAANTVLGTATSGPIAHTGGFIEVPNTAALPIGTRSIGYEMSFTLNAGTDLDAFVDDNSLTITTVPEPSAGALAALGAATLVIGGCVAKRRRALTSGS